MAYTPPAYNNLKIGSAPKPYTAPLYNYIIIGGAQGIGRYAIVLYQNHMATISSALLGTGLSPIVVMDNGEYRTRQGTEGTPLVMIDKKIVPLPTEDYLLI